MLCLRAFAQHDYVECARQAGLALAKWPSHEITQLLLISLQRTGQDRLADQLGARALAEAARYPWEQALLKLTLGRVASDIILGQAKTPSQRCQALFYSGARLLTEGKVEAARKALAGCMAFNVKCAERGLAEFERDSPPPPGYLSPDQAEASRRVAELSHRFSELHQEGDLDQAQAVALEAVGLARGSLGEKHPVTATSLNNLGVSYSEMGDYRMAELILRLALSIRVDALGKSHPDVANSLNNLGSIRM